MSDKQITGVKVWLDKNFLQTTKGSGELLTNLEKLNITTIIEKLPVDNGIFWTRKSSNSKNALDETQHDHILVKLDLDNFIDHLHSFYSSSTSNSLLDLVQNVKKNAQVTQVTLLVPGFKQFFK